MAITHKLKTVHVEHYPAIFRIFHRTFKETVTHPFELESCFSF